MSTRRRPQGDETRSRLLDWTDGQKASERLSGHILAAEGFDSVDPSQPLGGPDGLKDLTCWKDGIKWVVAVYFPNGHKPFTSIKSKFSNDVKGAIANNTDGFVFITNQHLTVRQRETLRENAPTRNVEIYHLERIAHILDTPVNYGVRQDFLGIEMTKEELLASFVYVTTTMTDEWRKFRGELMEDVRRQIQEAWSQHQD